MLWRRPGHASWIIVPAGQHALLSGALTDALENARPCPRGLSCPQASTRFLSGALTGPWRMPGHASWIIVPAGQHVPRAEAVHQVSIAVYLVNRPTALLALDHWIPNCIDISSAGNRASLPIDSIFPHLQIDSGDGRLYCR